MLFIVTLHHPPLSVVNFLGRAAAPMHGDEERPTIRGPRPNILHHVRAQMPSRTDLFCVIVLFEGLVDGSGPIGLPGNLAHGGFVATDRKSTRLNSSHEWISYAVFCLK